MNKVPNLRFRGFEGEWEEKKLGEVMDSFSGGTPSVGVKKYYGGDIPFIRSGEIHSDRTQLFITEEGLNNSSAKMVNKGTLLYALYGATSGDVAIAKIDGAINQAVLAINPQSQYDSVFLENYLLKNKQTIIDTYLQGGQGNLSGQIVKNVDLIHPSLPEQQRIASYFTHLDTLIEASRKKVEKYKQVKAASLQALFPKHGESVPKLRFKGCEGEWKKVSFEEVLGFLKNNSLSRAELSDEGSVMNVHYGDVLIKYPEFLDVTQEKMTYVKDSLLADKLYKSCPLQDGDVVIADAAEDETVGKCTELVNVDSTPIVSGLHTIPVRPRFSFASKYLGFFLNSNLFHDQLLVHIQGSKISSISRSAILKTFVYFPSLHEQHLIAQYFTHLDALLTLEQQRYEKLQQVKKASLSQMFA